MGAFIDLTNKIFGRLTVVNRGPNIGKNTRWYCSCSCGNPNQVLVRGELLRGGRTRSCGCLALETRIKHGLYETRVYQIWHNMNSRCNNKNNKHYGGRGIIVCEQWTGVGGFERFLSDMDYPPSDNYTIDRIDPNGNYTPENCRWATMKDQGRNKRTTKLTSIDVQTIKSLHSTGNYTYAALARTYNCDPTHIRKIVIGQRWK